MLALSIVSGYNYVRETRPGLISVVCVVTNLMAAISAFKLYVYSGRMLKRREVALKNAREHRVRPPPISINCSDSIPTISVLFIYQIHSRYILVSFKSSSKPHLFKLSY